MRVGWRRRALAVAAAALAASAICAAVLALWNALAGAQRFADWASGVAVAFLLCLAFISAGGVVIGLVIDRVMPRRTPALLFHAVAAGSGALAAIALMRAVWQVQTIWTVPAMGALAGLVAAAVWWKMVRAKERMANG